MESIRFHLYMEKIFKTWKKGKLQIARARCQNFVCLLWGFLHVNNMISLTILCLKTTKCTRPMGSCSFVAFEKFIRPYWHQIVLEIMSPPKQKAPFSSVLEWTEGQNTSKSIRLQTKTHYYGRSLSPCKKNVLFTNIVWNLKGYGNRGRACFLWSSYYNKEAKVNQYCTT